MTTHTKITPPFFVQFFFSFFPFQFFIVDIVDLGRQ
jgi:hypothetical protein